LRELDPYSFSIESYPRALKAKLDANENWHVPRSLIRAILETSVRHVDPREYPQDAVQDLREGISGLMNLPAGCVVPSSGGDQAIDLLSQVFLGKNERAIMVGPTFSMYRLRALITGAQCIEVQMTNDFALPLPEILRRAGRGGVLFVCSPNNPTGNQFGEEEVKSVLESFPGLVVLDEAYVEFADFSLCRLVRNFDNLVVLRTFSKAFGMAGLRLGYILANEGWATDLLARAQFPYPVSSLASKMATAVIERYPDVQRWADAVKRERRWLAAKLRELTTVNAFDSSANFIMVSLSTDSSLVQRRLLAAGVATRNLGRILNLDNCLRITVGTRAMNEALLDGLAEAVRQ
jgi:histidinol-phosphate aminotransferase